MNVTTTWPEYSALPKSESVHNVSANPSDQFATTKYIVNRVIIPLLYFAIFVVGIVANSIVIYATSIFKMSSKGAIDIYVGNLAIADLSLIATLPFWAVTHIHQGVWNFGNAMCKIASTLTHVNMYSSVFLITAMAIDRHTVVVKGIKVKSKSLRSASKTWFTCGAIWFSSIILSIPSALFRKENTWKNSTFCSWKYPANQTQVWWVVHVVERNVIGFLIPLIIICRCYFVLISYVRSRRNAPVSIQGSEVRSNQVHRITKMVTTIILAFTICWLPNQTSNFIQSLIYYKVIPSPRGTPTANVYYMLHLFFTSLSFCNSVINPIIYSTSPSHRRRVKNGSPECCQRNRRHLFTRIGHNTPGSPYATHPTSLTDFQTGNDPTAIKQLGDSCIGDVESEEACLVQSPINAYIPTSEESEDTHSVQTSIIPSVSGPTNHHDYGESAL